MSRNPLNRQKTLYDYFYLPDYGERGQQNLAKYNLSYESLDRWLKQHHDKMYSMKDVFSYSLVPPSIDWFSSYDSNTHKMGLRAMLKFEEFTDATCFVDESDFGNSGSCQYVARVNPDAWHTIQPGDTSETPFFIGVGDACLELKSGIKNYYSAEIPGLLHEMPESKQLTFEFWFCPTKNWAPGVYKDGGFFFNKINRGRETRLTRQWFSDEFGVGIDYRKDECGWVDGYLSFGCHNYDLEFEPSGACDFDWGYIGTLDAVWMKGTWYHVAVCWEQGHALLYINGLKVNEETSSQLNFPDGGSEYNFVIGNYMRFFNWQNGLDCLFTDFRISDKIRTAEEVFTTYNQAFSGTRVSTDSNTIALYRFDEGLGNLSTNYAGIFQTSNFPVSNQTGIVRKESQPYRPQTTNLPLDPPDETNSTKCCKFERDNAHYIDLGNNRHINLLTQGSEKIIEKFTFSCAVKRQSFDTRQCLLSKWGEKNQRQFWFGFNEDNKLELNIGLCDQTEEQEDSTAVMNQYTYIIPDASKVPVEYQGMYAGKQQWEELNGPEYDGNPYVQIENMPSGFEFLNGIFYRVNLDNPPALPDIDASHIKLNCPTMPQFDGYYILESSAQSLTDGPWYTMSDFYNTTNPHGSFKAFKIEDSECVLLGDTLNFDGIWVGENEWDTAVAALGIVGAPSANSLIWTTLTDHPVFRRVDSAAKHVIACLEADVSNPESPQRYTIHRKWVMLYDPDFVTNGDDISNYNYAHYSYYTRKNHAPTTWFVNTPRASSATFPKLYRYLELHLESGFPNTINFTNGKRVWRKQDNPDLTISVESSQSIPGSYALAVTLKMSFSVESFMFYTCECDINVLDASKPWFSSHFGFSPAPTGLTYDDSGEQVLQNTPPAYCYKKGDYYIYRDDSPWVDFHGWFIGKGMDHTENYYWAPHYPGVTDDYPSSVWWADYYGVNRDTGNITGTHYPLKWVLKGRPVFRHVDDPKYCIYSGLEGWSNQWDFWWLGIGSDFSTVVCWASPVDDSYSKPPVYWFYDQGANDYTTFDVHYQGLSYSLSTTLNVLRPTGSEYRTTIASDPITDSNWHHVSAVWCARVNQGKPKLFIDGVEATSYDIQQPSTEYIGWLDPETRLPYEWAPFQIGRTYDINETGPVQPGNYLDAYLDEVHVYATILSDYEIDQMFKRLQTGAQDGDRFYIDDPNKVIDVSTEAGYKPINAQGDWEGHEFDFAEWRLIPETGEWGWVFITVNTANIFWNMAKQRLESWLPEEYYEKYGDYGFEGGFKGL